MMKTVLMFFLLFSPLMAITAEEAAWVIDAETDLKKALMKAESEKKKMVLLVVVVDGCKWCELMVHETLSDDTIRAKLKAEAVTAVLDIGAELPEGFSASITPTMFFIDAKTGTYVLKQEGFVKPGSFLIDIVSASEEIE